EPDLDRRQHRGRNRRRGRRERRAPPPPCLAAPGRGARRRHCNGGAHRRCGFIHPASFHRPRRHRRRPACLPRAARPAEAARSGRGYTAV
ncbi:MAG: hypothetical protein AVDCRST_MAG68-2992, partial [uncultured Gemmatimonadetes bacterium]